MNDYIVVHLYRKPVGTSVWGSVCVRLMTSYIVLHDLRHLVGTLASYTHVRVFTREQVCKGEEPTWTYTVPNSRRR